jgi:MFS family permease
MPLLMATKPAAPDDGGTRRVLGLAWPARVTPAQKRSLFAGGLGWMLDAMDVMLYSMVLAELLVHLGITKPQAGFLNSLTLAASAVGGMAFGVVADRVGRTRALMASILVYSLASFACGLSQTLTQLALGRLVLGLGMGGEWATGAALIAETWPARHRGKALGLMQSAWAIGEAIAAAVTLVVLPRFGWRAVFFVGVLPALVVLWIWSEVPESPIWLERGKPRGISLAAMWRPDVRWKGVVATLMNACSMFGYWGLFTWIPGYLALPEAQGGRGLGIVASLTWVLIMAPGKWLGYTLFGFSADAIGRRGSYVVYLAAAAVLVPVFGSTRSLAWLLALGPLVGFFGTGFFSGFSAVASELFPTEVRATAMGVTYNVGRGFSALAPFAVGWVATRQSFFAAFLLVAAAFLLGAALALLLPETKGKQLE